jgi:hypothetical protein
MEVDNLSGKGLVELQAKNKKVKEIQNVNKINNKIYEKHYYTLNFSNAAVCYGPGAGRLY